MGKTASPRRGGKGIHKGWLALALALVLLGASAAALAYGCRMPDGVRLGGLDVGGMPLLEAKKALERSRGESLLGRELKILLPGGTIELSPEETGLELSSRKAVWQAFCQTRGEETGTLDLGLGPWLTYSEAPIREKLQAWAAEHDTALTQPLWHLEGEAPDLRTDGCDPAAPGQTLYITRGIPEQHLDVEGVLGDIAARYHRAYSEEETLTVEVAPEALPEEPDLDAISRQICREPEADSLDMETYAFVHGSYGYAFDREAAEELLEAADFGETVSLAMVTTAPDILGEQVYFRDVLGAYETRHNDNENRNTNLKLLCSFLDGLVVQPGEEFSYNGAVGERTAERGFKPAPAYSGNRLVQDYGGGVCQGSTTLYNCLLLGDMEILERNCHGAAVGYVPKGLDAAVNWATKTDLRFRNNSHFPVKIQAEVSGGYVKMKLLGTDEKDYTVKMESYSFEDEIVVYGVSYKCKIDKKTGEQISREVEARSTYYKNVE